MQPAPRRETWRAYSWQSLTSPAYVYLLGYGFQSWPLLRVSGIILLEVFLYRTCSEIAFISSYIEYIGCCDCVAPYTESPDTTYMYMKSPYWINNSSASPLAASTSSDDRTHMREMDNNKCGVDAPKSLRLRRSDVIWRQSARAERATTTTTTTTTMSGVAIAIVPLGTDTNSADIVTVLSHVRELTDHQPSLVTSPYFFCTANRYHK